MSSEVERKVLGFGEWLGEVERRSPEKVFVRIKGVKDIMVGEVYEYEPWFRDDRIQFYGYLPAQSRPYMSEIHEKLVRLGYVVYGFGEHGGEVIVHYRRGDKGMKIYRFKVDDKCPHCGWRVSTAYVLASSEGEAKNLMESDIWLCGNCMADMLVDESYMLQKLSFE
ncbi:MAG: hypothetical protein DRN68_04730 [Thaumarchaeota archaeon]|nr:MAG: hypothetical protein DRN68_04730 [Nitrososphaerota archaeon]